MLLGREPERAAIEQLLADARVGTSGVLVVTGEPGIGKSALLAHAVENAAGMRVLSARGVEGEASIPFAGLLELLRPVLGHVEHLPAPQAAALRAALAIGPGVEGERLVIGAATLGVLASVAEEGPLCVLLDDAQWIDQPSAEAVLFAARRLLADPVGIIVALRSNEASPLADARLPAVALAGLDLAASEALLTRERAGPVPAGSAERLFRATGGNPLALIELAGEAEGVAASLVEGPLPIATTVERAFAARASRLGEMARRSLLVAGAASTGDLIPIGRAAELLGVEITALQEAEAAGLVVVADGRIEFRHPLVRSAVHSAADPAERRAVHGALAQALTDDRYADERAWHLGAAAFGPDEAAADALADAAARARERGAYAAAALTGERAARLTAAGGVRGRRLLEAASNVWIAGSGERAAGLLDEAAPLVSDGEVTRDIALLRGHVALGRGDAMHAREVLRAAAQNAPDDDRRTAQLWAEAAFASFSAGRVQPMLDDARAACAALPAHDDGAEACMAHLALGMALVLCGAGDEGPRALRAAVAMKGYERLLAGPPLLWRWAIQAPLFLRETRTARESIGRALASARERGVAGALPLLLQLVGRDAATTDRWPEARARYYESAEVAHHTGQPGEECASLAGLAWLEAREGREASCRAHAADALELARTYERGLHEAWALAALGDLELALGRPAEAVERLSDMSAMLERLGIADVDLSPAPELVEALVQCGRNEEAVAAAHVYRRRAAAKGQPWALARAARADGLVADDDDFPAAFEEACRWHEATPDSFERARSELAYGERLRRARRRGDARSHLRAAFTAFQHLGAEPWAERARLELAATGETARKRDPSTLDQLTPRELQIGLELASGLTTREAAGKLYLSPKTIEYHLRSVYRKLGIASRGELTEAFARDDAVPNARR
jgi:DNA-binding CsgD family transcriptional regulator